MLKTIIGRKCPTSGCEDFGKIQEVGTMVCEKCGVELQQVEKVNSVAIALLGIAAAIVVSSGGYFAWIKVVSPSFDLGKSLKKIQKVVEPTENPSQNGTQPQSEERAVQAAKTAESAAQNATNAVLTAYFENGMGYASQHQYENALKAFTKVEEGNPHFDGLQMNIGVTYLELKDYAKAEEHLKRAQNDAPNQPRVEYNMACLYALTARQPEALRWLRSAISHGFKDVKALQTDSDLRPLRGSPEFQALLRQVAAK